MSGAIPLFLLYGLMECTGKTLSLLRYTCLFAQHLVFAEHKFFTFNTFDHIIAL